MRGAALLLTLLLAGCAPTPVDSPTLQLPFTTSASAPLSFLGTVQVGTHRILGFGVMNLGNQALVVEAVSYAGDPEMALAPGPSSALPASVAFNQELDVFVTCSPQAAATYTGTVTIVSNAVNTPTASVYLACTGSQ